VLPTTTQKEGTKDVVGNESRGYGDGRSYLVLPPTLLVWGRSHRCRGEALEGSKEQQKRRAGVLLLLLLLLLLVVATKTVRRRRKRRRRRGKRWSACQSGYRYSDARPTLPPSLLFPPLHF
jgi:hypothetical protein